MIFRMEKVACLVLLAMFFTSGSWATFETYTNRPTINTVEPTPYEEAYTSEEPVYLDPDSGDVVVIRTTQKVDLNTFAPHLVEFTNLDISQIRELRSVARAICAMEGGFAQIVRDKVSKEQKRYIMVTCPPFQWPYIETALKTLDKSWLNCTDDGSSIVVWEGQNRDIESINALASRYTGKNADFDPRDNTGTYIDYPSEAATYIAIARAVDIPLNKMLIDAKFYEVDARNDLKMGLDYIAWKNGPGADLFDIGVTSFQEHINITGNAVNNNYRNRYRGYHALATASYLDFLQSKGKAKNLAEASVQAVSGNVGYWESIDPVVSLQVSGSNLGAEMATVTPPTPTTEKTLVESDGWDRAVNRIKQGNAGLFLAFRAGVAILSSEVAIMAAANTVSGYAPNGMPMISETFVETNARVTPGETLLIGGMTRNELVKEKNGVPFLCDLPVLGYIFGGETTVNRTKKIYVLIDSTVTTGLVDATAGTPLTHDQFTKIIKDSSIDDAARYTKMKPAVAELSETAMATKAQALGETDMPTVTNAFGFDQWLLDPEKN